MYVDLHCGGCECSLLMDSDENTSGVWMLVHRFANAHYLCGFVTPPSSSDNEPVKTTNVTSVPRRRVVKKSRVVEDDE